MKHTHRLLISLDSLLDTRAGTLCLMDMPKAAKLMNNPQYGCRIVDWFEGFDKEEYQSRYKNRNVKTLSVSMMTRTYKILQDFLKRCYNRSLDTPHELFPEIHVNFYPYQLPEETQNLIINALREKLPQAPVLKPVNISQEDLTPGLLKNTYGTVVIYDFLDWIEFHAVTGLIKKTPIPEVTFFTPALVKTVDEKFPKDIPEMFIDMMAYFQFFANVVFLPVDNFCSVISVTPSSSPQATGGEELEDSKGLDVHWT